MAGELHEMTKVSFSESCIVNFSHFNFLTSTEFGEIAELSVVTSFCEF